MKKYTRIGSLAGIEFRRGKMPMTFTEFRGLWQAAQEAPDRDSFLAGRDQPEATAIYDMATGGMRAIRERTGLSQVRFAAAYNIPRRTCESWESESRTPPDYLPVLLAYAVLSDAG